MITFMQFVNSYCRLDVWKPLDDIVLKSGLPYDLVNEWYSLYLDTNRRILNQKGCMATDADLEAAYQQIHPHQHPVADGDSYIYVQDVNRDAGKIPENEYWQTMEALLRKVLGK